MAEIITIKYDGKEKDVYKEDFIRQSQKMLEDFGLTADVTEITGQVNLILDGEIKKLTIIGHFLKDYVKGRRA